MFAKYFIIKMVLEKTEDYRNWNRKIYLKIVIDRCGIVGQVCDIVWLSGYAKCKCDFKEANLSSVNISKYFKKHAFC